MSKYLSLLYLSCAFILRLLVFCHFGFRVCTLSICPRRPESRESIRRRCAAPLHRNRTSPPSLWPGRELRKYHCPQHLSSPPPGAARLLSCKLYRSLISEVVAHSRKRLRVQPIALGTCLDIQFSRFNALRSTSADSPFNGHFLRNFNHQEKIYFAFPGTRLLTIGR